MTTFAELRTSLSRRLMDPDKVTFDDDALSDMVNEAIQEVSRIAPQHFLEDISPITGRSRYRLRGGTANQVPNWSFESGDTTVLGSAPVTVAADDAPVLLEGWNLLADTPLHFPKHGSRITGLRLLRMVPLVGQSDATAYVDIPVNPDTAYLLTSHHCKEIVGGLASRIEVETRDSDNNLISSIFTHDTTSGSMVEATTTYTTADDGSEVYLRVKLICLGEQPATQQAFLFEDVAISEASQNVLVSTNAVSSIEVSRVEIWQMTDGVGAPVYEVPRPGDVRGSYSNNGWRVWGGTLELPPWVVNAMDGDMYFRVWGYAPYDTLTDDQQVTDLTAELEWAVLTYGEIKGLRRLLMTRSEFKQWQTQANNTDVTPASLINQIALLEQEWSRKQRSLFVLRS